MSWKPRALHSAAVEGDSEARGKRRPGSQAAFGPCVITFTGVSRMSFTVFLFFQFSHLWNEIITLIIVVVEWGDIGGVLSLASGTLVCSFQEPVGCDWNFQLFPIQTWDSLYLCLLYWSGSGDSQPLLGALGYPSWVLLFHCLRTLPDLGAAYLCGPCYWKTSSVKYQFFFSCFPQGDSSFLIWALCSRSVFFPVLLRQWEENLKFVWWDSCFRIDRFDWAKIETSVLTAVLQPSKGYSLSIFSCLVWGSQCFSNFIVHTTHSKNLVKM